MSLLADYDPDPSRRPSPVAARVRLATADDAPVVARISAERDGLDATEIEPKVGADLQAMTEDDDHFVFVAEWGGDVIGYSRLRRLDPGPDAPPNAVPAGWYLCGIVVAPAWRRRGVGAALTGARIEWAAARTDRLLYFTSERNQVSVDLHDKFGFREVARDVCAPRVTFTAGAGVLYELLFVGESTARADPPAAEA